MNTDVRVATLVKLPVPPIFADTIHILSFYFISIVPGSLVFFRPSQQFIFFSDPLKYDTLKIITFLRTPKQPTLLKA